MSGTPASVDGQPVATGRRDLWIDLAWFAILAVWSAAWCLTAADRIGATFDEPFYLGTALDRSPQGLVGVTAINGVMPLPVMTATIPVRLHEWRTGTQLEEKNTVELIKLLGAARGTNLFWFWLLIFAAMRLGRATAGPWAGRIAAALIAADPNFLAHASLATTDIAVTAALVGFTWAVSVGRGGGWWRRVVLPGLWFGVAVLCKLSALLYGGVIIVALEVLYRISSGALVRPTGAGYGAWGLQIAGATLRSVLSVAAVIAVGVVVTIVVFGFPPPGHAPLSQIAPKIPDSEPLKPRYTALAAKYDPVPYAVAAFAFQLWHNSTGRPSYLNGTYYPEGWRFHFPVLMAMKIPVAALLLGLVALLRMRRGFSPLVVVALALVAVSLTAKLQIGVRLVLPAIALGYIAVAVAVVRGFARCGVWLGVLTVVAVAATSVWVWPYGLGYLNQLAGGPSAAAARVSDSNLDWGQGIPDLLAWHKANGEPPIKLWYFGTDPAAWQPPFTQIGPERAAITNGDELKRLVGPHYLAVGTTILSLHPELTASKREAVAYLRTLTPVARTSTFVIYDLRGHVQPARE
ncbi:MAG: hypothetical protein C0467_08280 [Planctomycetaceae bacterium]|nr:hypothetical protein [Planctomycetaceae bacterium]